MNPQQKAVLYRTRQTNTITYKGVVYKRSSGFDISRLPKTDFIIVVFSLREKGKGCYYNPIFIYVKQSDMIANRQQLINEASELWLLSKTALSASDISRHSRMCYVKSEMIKKYSKLSNISQKKLWLFIEDIASGFVPDPVINKSLYEQIDNLNKTQ